MSIYLLADLETRFWLLLGHSPNTIGFIYWKLKQKNSNNDHQDISWKLVAKTISSNGNGKKCNICLYEKFIILQNIDNANLFNKRNELIVTSRHSNNVILKTVEAI